MYVGVCVCAAGIRGFNKAKGSQRHSITYHKMCEIITHEDRGIHNPQPHSLLHRQIRIQRPTPPRRIIARLPHRNRARPVRIRVRPRSGIRIDLVVRLGLRKRSVLRHDPVRPGGRGHESSCRFDGFTHVEDIEFARKKVGREDGVVKCVGTVEGDIAAGCC